MANVRLTESPHQVGYTEVFLKDRPYGHPAEQLEAAETALTLQIEDLKEQIPEIETEQGRIVRGGAELISRFQVRPEFFQAVDRSLIFFSLALNNARQQELVAAGRNVAVPGEQREFIGNATFLLTRRFADAHPELVALHERQTKDGPEGERANLRTVEKYQQPELTAQLRSYVQEEGVLDEIQKRLGLEQKGEEVAPIHVLSIGQTTQGFFETQISNEVGEAEFAAWLVGIGRRTEDFASSVPRGELAAKANAYTFEAAGHHHICLPQLAAELVLAERNGLNLKASEAVRTARQWVLASIGHEYVHARYPVEVEDEFGLSLEERRAEWFSGDKGEYFEVKRFFRHLQILYGRDIGDMLNQIIADRKYGQETSIYSLLANEYGLGKVAEIAGAQPNGYVKHAESTFARDMTKALGGFDRLIVRSGADPRIDRNAALNRLRNGVNSIRLRNGGIDAEQEDAMGRYLAPVLAALNIRLRDLP